MVTGNVKYRDFRPEQCVGDIKLHSCITVKPIKYFSGLEEKLENCRISGLLGTMLIQHFSSTALCLSQGIAEHCVTLLFLTVFLAAAYSQSTSISSIALPKESTFIGSKSK